MEYLQPSMVISFSSALSKFFSHQGMLTSENEGTKEILSGNRIVTVYKGYASIGGRDIRYVYLPHPNYPIQGKSGEEAWDFCKEACH